MIGFVALGVRVGLQPTKGNGTRQRVSMNAQAAHGRDIVRMNAKLADMLERVPADLRHACLALPGEADMVDPLERRTKIVCTIGPSSSSYESLLRLAAEGMNLVRLNMSHGDYSFHKSVLKSIRRINAESPFLVGTIVDLGSANMVRLGEFSSPPQVAKGSSFTLTVRHEAEYDAQTSEVSYDGFFDGAEVGDLVHIDETVEMIITSMNETDAVCEVIKGGLLRSRAPIALRGKKDTFRGQSVEIVEGDLEFVVSEGVDYVSLAFVEEESAVENLRAELRRRGSDALIIAKMESAQALRNAEAIIRSADAIMIARGDLGTAIAYEKVPLWQERIASMCRVKGKPVLISTHFLDSMVTFPTPTRAEITDIFEAVRQKADALVLTAETASGRFPFKSLSAMHSATRRMETKQRESFEIDSIPPLVSRRDSGPFSKVALVAENIANTAAILANQRLAKAIIVFTQKGLMANLVSRNRPNAPIIAFTPIESMREKMTLLHGVRPFVLEFADDPEETIAEAFSILEGRGWVSSGDVVVIVADVLGGKPDAPEAEKRAVFDEFAKGSNTISPLRVRAALRRMCLKAPDAVEMNLSRGGNPLDFDSFNNVATHAKQIVHTVQLRHCP